MVDISKIARMFCSSAERYDKKGWLQYVMIGIGILMVYILWKMIFR